jgi:DNA polymerase IV
MSTYTQTLSPTVVHFDLDTFFVSVERLLDPALERRPVIVGGNPFGRGVVAGCSYEARAYGVHSAQPIRLAYRLCPQAAFLHGSYIHYAQYSNLVKELLEELVPVCEKASVDEFYLDLSRCESLKGDAYKWAQEIKKIVRGETHLPLSLGLATNKLVAKVATTQVAKNNQERHHAVQAGYESLFLAPLQVRALPGIGEVMEKKLEPFGIERLGQLAATPVQILERLFGKTGRVLREKARGIDYSQVTVTREQQSYSREETFGEDTLDAQFIFQRLLKLSSQLGEDLRKGKAFSGKFSVKLRYSDFTTVTKSITCSYTNRDKDIYQLAEKLFRRLWTRRIRVRLIGIEATGLIEDIEQQALFPDETEDDKCLVLDSIRNKYGKHSIGYAAAMVG